MSAVLPTKPKDEKKIAQELFERINESKWGISRESNQTSLLERQVIARYFSTIALSYPP